MSNFSNLIKNHRLIQNLTQFQASELTGIPRCKISRYENGHQIPSNKNLEKLLKIYKIDLQDSALIKQEWTFELKKRKSFNK
jgi:transcriptional regulator with XRE-family HTH domain